MVIMKRIQRFLKVKGVKPLLLVEIFFIFLIFKLKLYTVFTSSNEFIHILFGESDTIGTDIFIAVIVGVIFLIGFPKVTIELIKYWVKSK